MSAGDAAGHEQTLTRRLGDFVADLDFEDLPTELVEHAELFLLDTLGCGLFGSTLEWSRILNHTVAKVDRDTTSAVWGTSQRLGPLNAALANGAAVHGFELDDLHKESILHAGSVVAPAVFAAADIRGPVQGAEILTALVAGYEVGARIGMTIGTDHLLQGWHPTGTHGALAAAVGASHVLGLCGVQIQHALGIAASQSSGLMAAQYSSMVKRYHAGRAAQSGLYSALLAREGYTGILDVLENEYGGYCSTFSPTKDLTRVAEELGVRWEALAVGFKPYSANGSCHPTIELLADLRRDVGFGPDDVERIVVHTSTATFAHVGWPYVPDSVTTAQMNLHYIAAVVVTDGEAFVDQFAEHRLADPALLALADRVDIIADPQIDARGPAHRHETRLSVHLTDGRTYSADKLSARGSANFPLSGPEVREKYRRLAAKAVDPAAVARIEELVGGLADLRDHAELTRALRAGPTGPLGPN
jgi:2-methylcitrate dehydratase PrpD